MNKIRHWLMRMVSTEDEKFLITRAIEQRIRFFENEIVMNRFVDHDNLKKDIEDYKKLKKPFLPKDEIPYEQRNHRS